jgi:hypothetical protein
MLAGDAETRRTAHDGVELSPILRDRGWSKKDNPQTAWAAYQEKPAALGNGYVQCILRLTDGTRTGESFFTPLPDSYTFGKWQKPDGIACLIGDIKLLPAFWDALHGDVTSFIAARSPRVFDSRPLICTPTKFTPTRSL